MSIYCISFKNSVKFIIRKKTPLLQGVLDGETYIEYTTCSRSGQDELTEEYDLQYDEPHEQLPCTPDREKMAILLVREQDL